jgi:hypothetical protein
MVKTIIRQDISGKLRGLKEYRIMYNTFSKSGIDKSYIKKLEELYNDLVINDVLPSSGFKDVQIPKIDGMYRVFKDR